MPLILTTKNFRKNFCVTLFKIIVTVETRLLLTAVLKLKDFLLKSSVQTDTSVNCVKRLTVFLQVRLCESIQIRNNSRGGYILMHHHFSVHVMCKYEWNTLLCIPWVAQYIIYHVLQNTRGRTYRNGINLCGIFLK